LSLRLPVHSGLSVRECRLFVLFRPALLLFAGAFGDLFFSPGCCKFPKTARFLLFDRHPFVLPPFFVCCMFGVVGLRRFFCFLFPAFFRFSGLSGLGPLCRLFYLSWFFPLTSLSTAACQDPLVWCSPTRYFSPLEPFFLYFFSLFRQNLHFSPPVPPLFRHGLPASLHFEVPFLLGFGSTTLPFFLAFVMAVFGNLPSSDRKLRSSNSPLVAPPTPKKKLFFFFFFRQ